MKLQPLNSLSNANNISLKGTRTKNSANSVQTKTRKDDFISSQNSFESHISREYYKNGVSRCFKTTGHINDKSVNINVDYSTRTLLHRNYIVEGVLGEDEVNLKIDSKGIRGTIGNKRINLQYNPASFAKLVSLKDLQSGVDLSSFTKPASFSGQIGDKTIDIATGSPISATQGENDILILTCMLGGTDLSVKDGKLKLV